MLAPLLALETPRLVGEHAAHTGPDFLLVVGPVAGFLAVAGYLWLVGATRGRGWPRRRSLMWVVGTVMAAGAVSGPLGEAAQSHYIAHMAAHVLLGMAVPLLLVLAAPVTLLLRALPTARARRLSRLLRSRPVRYLTEPVVAAVLNAGGLWLLYTSDLYSAMHHHAWVHVFVHAHMFLAGYLFTAAIISVDPLPHRRSYPHRAAVLVLALAAHDILAKHLYVHSPPGVTGPAVETGAMLMYYGGDAIDLALIVVLCARWYRATRPRAVAGTRGPGSLGGLGASSGPRAVRT